MKEKFTCPNCNTFNLVEWKPNETSRLIPCNGCFYEEWLGGQPIEESKVDSPKGLVYTQFTENTKIEHGHKITCQKGSGITV